MSRQSILHPPEQSDSQETLTNSTPSLPLQRLCAGQSELLRNHDAALQEVLVAIKIAFQPTEDVADGKAEEIPKEETRPRCILSYAWPSDPYQEKEVYLQPFLDFLYEHLRAAGIEVHLDFREPEFDTTGQRETIYDTIHRHYRPGTFIVLMGTESLRAQHEAVPAGPMQYELDRVRTCLSQADGSVYPLLLSGTRDSAYPDDIAGYIKTQNAENLTYLNLLQQLINRLYSQDTQNFWETLETSATLSENTEAINEALSHQLHQSRLTDLQQTPAYQTIQMQRQKKISKCLRAKLFIEFQKAMGEPIQYIRDEHGFMFQRPPENDHFIKRPALLTHLNNYFLQPGRQLLTLTAQGLGGVGKTQLAQHVYLHPPQPYALRAWFQAGSREQLSIQYIALGKAQGVKFADELPLEEKVARVLRWLEQQPDCLLMYDDVRDKAMLEGLLPQKGSSHILITTRHGKAWPVSQCLDVDVMELEEAKDLIEAIAGPQDPTELGALVNALGCLPLALAQAAWYMRQQNGQCDAAAYLTLYEAHQKHLMQHTEGLPRSIKNEEKWEKHEAVWVTFDINFQALKQTCPEALLTLNQASWLASTPIPETLLEYSSDDSSKTSRSERLFAWTRIKKHIKAYSLMQIDMNAQTLCMHNLVQDILRDQQIPTQKIQLFKQICNALDILRDHYGTREVLEIRRLVTHAKRLYQHNVSIASLAEVTGDAEAILIRAKPIHLGIIYQALGMINKSLDILQQQRVVFEKYYAPNDPMMAMMLANLGNAYGDIGNYKKQCELLNRALLVYEECLGKNHFEVAKTLFNLSIAYAHLGDFEKQFKSLNRALPIQEAHFGPNHDVVAATLSALGGFYGSLGDWEKHREYLKRALTIQVAFFEPNHPTLAFTLNSLGCAYGALGEPNKQRELQERALIIGEKFYGPEHPEVVIHLINLGNACGELGDWEKQGELQARALKIQERFYGSNYSGLGITLTNLGRAYTSLDKAKKACKLLKRALTIKEKFYGLHHPEVAATLVSLGVAHVELGNFKKCRDLLERALAIEEVYFSPNNIKLAITLVNLGVAYNRLGDIKKQRELQERALRIEEVFYGLDHPRMISTLVNLSNAYERQGNIEETSKLLIRVLNIKEALYGADHHEVAAALSDLGNAYVKLGHAKEAHKLLKRALIIQKSFYGSDHHGIAKTLCRLGNVNALLGNIKRQRKLQERALTIQEVFYGSGPYPLEVGYTLFNLGSAYGTLGKTQKQCDLQERALPIFEASFGREDLTVARLLNILGCAYNVLANAEKQCEYQERALTIQEKYYGQAHPKIAATLYNLAKGYIELNNFNQAISLLKRLHSILYKCFPQGHPKITEVEMFVKRLQVNVHLNQNKYLRPKGRGIYSHMNFSCANQVRTDGDPRGALGSPWETPPHVGSRGKPRGIRGANKNPKKISQKLNKQGVEHYKAKDYASALMFFQEALALQQQSEGPNAESELAVSYFNVGSTLFFLEQYEKAKVPLEQSYQLRLKLFGLSHSLTQKVKERMELCSTGCNQDLERNLNSVNYERDTTSHDESPEIPIITESIETNDTSIAWNRCTLFATGVVAVTAIGAAWYLNEKTDVIDLFQNLLSGSVPP